MLGHADVEGRGHGQGLVRRLGRMGDDLGTQPVRARRPVGPCCSFDPIGTTTVLDSGASEAIRDSISGQDDK